MEEVERALPQRSERIDTPPAQNTQADQTPSPPPEVTPVQPAEHISRERPSSPPISTPPEITANAFERSRLPPASTTTHYSQTNLSPPSPSPPFPVPAAPQTPETGFQIIATPEFYEDDLSLKPRSKPMDISTVPSLTSLQATDSPRNYGALVPQEAAQSVDVPLPRGAGPARRPGDVVLPDSLLPGSGRGSPAPPMSPDLGHSRPSSGSYNNVPLSLRPGTPRSASPAQQDFTGVGSLARANRDGSTQLNNAPPGVGPPSLMPLQLYSPTLDFGDFGGIKGYGSAGQPQRAPSNAGYGESKFMTNLEGEHQQEKRADPQRSNGSWR